MIWNQVDDDGTRKDAKLILGEQRNGPTSDAEVVFHKEMTRFENAGRWRT